MSGSVSFLTKQINFDFCYRLQGNAFDRDLPGTITNACNQVLQNFHIPSSCCVWTSERTPRSDGTFDYRVILQFTQEVSHDDLSRIFESLRPQFRSFSQSLGREVLPQEPMEGPVIFPLHDSPDFSDILSSHES